MLREDPYCSNLVAFVIDEAHCIKSLSPSIRLAALTMYMTLLPMQRRYISEFMQNYCRKKNTVTKE